MGEMVEISNETRLATERKPSKTWTSISSQTASGGGCDAPLKGGWEWSATDTFPHSQVLYQIKIDVIQHHSAWMNADFCLSFVSIYLMHGIYNAKRQ